MAAPKTPTHHEERRNERINKGVREKKRQRKALESLRRISHVAKNFDNVEEYFDEFDELYEDE